MSKLEKLLNDIRNQAKGKKLSVEEKIGAQMEIDEELYKLLDSDFVGMTKVMMQQSERLGPSWTLTCLHTFGHYLEDRELMSRQHAVYFQMMMDLLKDQLTDGGYGGN